ncbi:hypothetical protein ANO11243_049680 [Dothideomycetidae sp. 11243]|nr:hypothetical protein ANO11243_049680 [fungal sp. No.11243]
MWSAIAWHEDRPRLPKREGDTGTQQHDEGIYHQDGMQILETQMSCFAPFCSWRGGVEDEKGDHVPSWEAIDAPDTTPEWKKRRAIKYYSPDGGDWHVHGAQNPDKAKVRVQPSPSPNHLQWNTQ